MALKYTEELVTPKKAKEWLKKNSANRPISSTTMARYAAEMRLGRWMLNPQPIILTSSGTVLDGQHRLAAVIKAEKPQRFTICRGATKEVRKVIDHGRKRTTSDILKMEYGVQMAKRTAACARWVNILDNGERAAPSAETVLHMIQHPRFKRGFAWMQKADLAKGLSAAHFLGPLVWVSQKYARDAARFQASVVSGANLEAGSAALKLRDILLTSHTDTPYGFGLKTLNAFAYYLDGETPKKLFAKKESYRRFAQEFKIPPEAGEWILHKARLTRRIQMQIG